MSYLGKAFDSAVAGDIPAAIDYTLHSVPGLSYLADKVPDGKLTYGGPDTPSV